MIPYPRLALLAGIAFAIGLSWAPLNPYLYDIAVGIGISIILAVSLNLVNGHTGQFSLGHAGFMAVGGYSSAAITNLVAPHFLGSSTSAVLHSLAFLSALLAGGFGAALAGLLVGVPSLRLKGDYLAIVTLGFGEIIRVVLQNTEVVGASRGWSIASGYAKTVNGYATIVPYTNLAWTFALAAITVYVVTSLVSSTYGRGFLTVRDDEVAAEAMGINTTRFKVTAFVVGAFFAGIAGGLYAHFKQYLNPSGFDFMLSVSAVVMVILGGMGSTAGVILAAAILTMLPEWLRSVAGYAWLPPWLREIAKNRMILYSLLLIVLMLTRPQGLFGDVNATRRAVPGRLRRKA
ncbi:MAG: branched-chain amino acid transport system permease protein [Chthoniobacter sp.]|jgi:branched-chain amino acid transport system permease protein|nr:branched-chain amino acid transport system permease protein [Chthoniobacter sp.]